MSKEIGSDSGHTVVDRGRHSVLRHLPTPALLDDVIAVIPTGAYLDVDILLREAEETGMTKDRLFIHPMAVVIDESMKADEREAGLVKEIASTGQGIGGAVAQRAMRRPSVTFAGDTMSLRGFVRTDLDRILADSLTRGERVLIEGTQGFGLSILHGSYPYTASRDTTAEGRCFIRGGTQIRCELGFDVDSRQVRVNPSERKATIRLCWVRRPPIRGGGNSAG